MAKMGSESMDYRTELLSPMGLEAVLAESAVDQPRRQWRLNLDNFHIPDVLEAPPFVSRVLLRTTGNLSCCVRISKSSVHS